MNIIEIESKDNKKIKELNKLKLKKYRQKSGLFVVENWKIIQDAFRSDICFKEVFLTKDFLNRNKEELADTLGENGSVFLVADSIGKNFSSLESPQGIWAIYEIREKQIDFKKDIIYLNGINDPGNLGTILRSSLAFGLENIVLDEKCVDIYNPKVIQAAKDAIFKLNLAFDKNKEIIRKIKEKDIKVYITSVKQGENSSDIFSSDEKKCIVLGSESHGVEEFLEKEADKFINIKTTSKIESLNVAISAGIIFYELFKQRK
ncbi:MAG: RNA methyltransferase [Parcubacteria group bacterium]|jgi:TrmH family RNA methyltransferase